MGKYFALSMQIPLQQSEVKKRTYSPKKIERIGFVLAVLCVTLAVSQLFQVNSFSTKGFEIRNLQKDVAELAERNKKLQIQAAELQSLHRIGNEPETSGMTSVTAVTYIQNTSLSRR
jgi:cell division protein FtsL